MKIRKWLLISALVLSAPVVFVAQANTKKSNLPVNSNKAGAVKSSPAYAEVLLRKTELSAELEGLLVEYTEEFQKVKELRYESGLLQKELDRLLAINAADASKLSVALGKLMVRKCEIDTDLWSLLLQFNEQHPDVKRARRKSDMFGAAINDILQDK